MSRCIDPLAGLVVGALFGAILLKESVVVIGEKKRGIIELLGKHQRVLKKGVSVKLPFVGRVVHVADMRQMQYWASILAKTKDDLVVDLRVCMQ